MEQQGRARGARPTIDSPANPQVRLFRDLHEPSGRKEYGAFLLEGTRLVAEAVSTGWPILRALYDESRARDDEALAALVRQMPESLPATQRAIKHAAETVSPQGIVAAARLPRDRGRVAPSEPLVLVIDGVADPGNAGALLRSALGSGVRSVLSLKGSVDLFSPKVVRAAMGAHFRLRLITDLDWKSARLIAGNDRTLVIATMNGEMSYYEYNWLNPSALVIGSEATGPSTTAFSLAGASVGIPMEPTVESLNAAVAGSVIMFEARRQRDKANG